ncbi:MAG: phosphotransferase [Clostridia bacterium]|nr:phosphotransferase [Clostridia bacterium]
MEFNLKKIAESFQIEGEYVDASPYGEGHINSTFLLKTTAEEKYILQKINNTVFSSPEELMDNVVMVTEFLKKKIDAAGGNSKRETLTVIPAKDGKSYVKTENGDYYRVYIFIDDAISFQVVEDPMDFYNAAAAFGKFQNMLSDFEADKLHETIKNFHNTKTRFDDFEKAVADNKSGKAADVQAEIDFAMARKCDAAIIVDGIAEGRIPLRVTHNDTKLNNVLVDSESGKGICVIDLDTVMPGSLLYDFGDSIRFGTNPAAEDEKDLSKVYCDLNLFEHYVKGFLSEVGDSITKEEIELLPMSAKLMTLECGIRFLGDHLNGDVYFKIHRENHNLDRARTQFKMVADMEEKMEQMKAIVAKCAQ